MATTAACTVCGVSILAQTAERTGGRCMRCVRNPRNGRVVAQLAQSTTQEELLRRMDELVAAATLRHAAEAAATRKDDHIYGFWLCEQYFAMFNTAVFTEADLDRAVQQHPDSSRLEMRWVLHWTPVKDLDAHELKLTVAALEKQMCALDDDASDRLLGEVSLCGLRALRLVRERGVFDDGVVLTLGHWDQNMDEIYAYAEQVCPPAALQAFHRELPRLNEEDVATFRDHVPRLPDLD